MNTKQLEALLALEAKATPGPAKACHDEDGVPLVCIAPDHGGPLLVSAETPLSDADAVFFAAARNSLREILTEAIETRQKLAAYAHANDAVNRGDVITSTEAASQELAAFCNVLDLARRVAAEDAEP